MVSFSKINSFIRKAYNKSLFATNTATCVVLLGFGDCLTQYVEHKTFGVPASPQAIIAAAQSQTQMNLTSAPTTSTSMFNVDWTRNQKMITLGAAIGPIQHFWYTFLDKQFPKKTRSIIIKKVIIDQICFAPVLNLVLITGLHLLDGEKLSTLKNAIKEKFLTLYMYDCCLWIPAQLTNFSYISTKHRVLYINLVTLVWNTISSFVMFNDVAVNSQFE